MLRRHHARDEAAVPDATPSSAACTASTATARRRASSRRFRRSCIEEVRPRIQVSRPVIARRPLPAAGASKSPSRRRGMRLGARVRHGKFGEGVVLNLEGQRRARARAGEFRAAGRQVADGCSTRELEPRVRCTMKILILGAGQVGRTAAYHLAREPANEVTVVDINEEVLRDLQDRIDMRTVAGNASYPDGARSRRHRRYRHPRRADQQRRSEHGRLPDRVQRCTARRRRSRASAPPNTPAARQLFAEGALAVDVWISPEQLVTDYIERLIHYPGALQVRGFRRRPGAAGGRARAQGRAAGRPAAARRCASTCRRPTRASPRSTATAASSRPTATP